MAIDLIRTKTAHRDERSAVLMKTIGTLLFTLILKKSKSKEKINKKLLAMEIGSDTKQGRRIAGSISRSYESVGNPAVYLYFERLFCRAVWGHGLLFQRLGGERAGHSR
jgi:hypothetical protein